ncbi:MAG: SCO family protein [Gammaproteobacteria bacterium]|nr:SCO family protein [Gammaproteobacteria bacterium]
MISCCAYRHFFKSQIILFVIVLLFAHELHAEDKPTNNKPEEVVQQFQYKSALQASQDAIDRILSKHRFTDDNGKGVTMHDFLGKPLIISMVYTSCYQICPMTTRHLSKVVDKARETLGKDSFSVAVIGFDTQFDTPQKMKYFAEQQGVDKKGWHALSADADTIEALTKELGFVYFGSPNGFDHVVQATVIDEKGQIYRQVYGESFDTQLLLEPMLDLVLDRPKSSQSFLLNVMDKVRFFCTTYDARTDSYRFDYSLFIGMAIGFFIILFTILFIIREIRYARHYPRL